MVKDNLVGLAFTFHMKILIATDCNRYNLGGVTASIFALCTGLRRCGHEVKTLSLSNCNRSFQDGDDYYIRSFPAFFYQDLRISFAMKTRLTLTKSFMSLTMALNTRLMLNG